MYMYTYSSVHVAQRCRRIAREKLGYTKTNLRKGIRGRHRQCNFLVWDINLQLHHQHTLHAIHTSFVFRLLVTWTRSCPYIEQQRFRIFCMHVSGKRDKPTILNALTKVGVWNGNVFYLAAPIPISPEFCCPPKYGCQRSVACLVQTVICAVYDVNNKAKQMVNKSTTPRTTLFPRKKEKLP